MKAVQRAYGLAEHPDGGMHLLTSAEFETIPPTKDKATDPPLPRKLTDPEMIDVDDRWKVVSTGRYDDKRSWVPGSAAALAAYMIALINDGLAIPNTAGATGIDACTTIRNNLADGGTHSIPSYLVGNASHGIKSLANVTKKQFNKIGILQNSSARSRTSCPNSSTWRRRRRPRRRPASATRCNTRSSSRACGRRPRWARSRRRISWPRKSTRRC